MATGFTPAVMELIHHRYVLTAVKQRLWLEWRDMLDITYQHLTLEEWTCCCHGNPTNMLQFFRGHWPNAEGQIHYEILCNEDFFEPGIVDLSLHIENRLSNQEAVCGRVRSLLKPYEAKLLARLAGCAPSLPTDPLWDILKGRLPLGDLTAEVICEAVDRMIETESFVDEALFLAGKTRVWRTDFFANDAKPYIAWHTSEGIAETGGWDFSDNGGRFDSPCLKCTGGKSNYHDGKNIATFRPNQLFHELGNSQPFYCSAVVNASRGGELRFYAEAPKEGGFVAAWDEIRPLDPSNQWQVVTCEGYVSNPENYDFAKQGMHVFVIVKTPEAGLKIDSIEVGLSS